MEILRAMTRSLGRRDAQTAPRVARASVTATNGIAGGRGGILLGLLVTGCGNAHQPSTDAGYTSPSNSESYARHEEQGMTATFRPLSRLNNQQITEKLSGRQIRWLPSDGSQSESFYADGRWKGSRGGRALRSQVGKWRVENSQLCVDILDQGEECRAVFDDMRSDIIHVSELYSWHHRKQLYAVRIIRLNDQD